MEYDKDGRYVLFRQDEISLFNDKQRGIYNFSVSLLSKFCKDEIYKAKDIDEIESKLHRRRTQLHDRLSLYIIDEALDVVQLQRDKYGTARIVDGWLLALGTPARSIRYYINLKATKDTFLEYRSKITNEECRKILYDGFEELLKREAIYSEFGIDLHSEFVTEEIVNLPISDDKQAFHADTSICKGIITNSDGAYLDVFGYIRFDDTDIYY